jgi:hypothetical protein
MPELRIVISGLTSPWPQAQVTPHIATSSEPFLATEGQYEGQGGEMADTMNLQQRLRLRILGLAELLDLPVVLLDLQRHFRDLLEHRTERLSQPSPDFGKFNLQQVVVSQNPLFQELCWIVGRVGLLPRCGLSCFAIV